MKLTVAAFVLLALLAGIFWTARQPVSDETPSELPIALTESTAEPASVPVVAIGTAPGEQLDLPKPEAMSASAEVTQPTEETAEPQVTVKLDHVPKAVINMQRRIIGKMLDKSYGPLLANLGLDEETNKQLRALLVDREMIPAAHVQEFFKIRNDAENAAFMATIQAKESEVDEKIRGVLSEDDYADYEVYSETVGIRGQLAQLEATVNAVGDPLDSKQREDMVALLHLTLEKYYGENYQYPGETLRVLVAGATPEEVIANLGKMDQELLNAAESLLRPGQHDAFTAYRKSRSKGGAKHVYDMVEILANGEE